MNLEEFMENKTIENATVEKIARELVSNMQVPEFGIGGVPTSVAAKVMGKSETYVREGIEQGWLPIGSCPRNGTRCNPYISPKLFWEYTGYVWKGEETCET
jgi:hypothetical protein|nr:MAG TPA: protein of unknown function (DUF1737) [Caudoviricetes sp.]